MSGSPATKRQWFTDEPAPVGSKRWFREKRMEHVFLWMMPLMPAGYTLTATGVSMPWQALVATVAPTAIIGAALAYTSYALWRIEVNVAANRAHPITPKDGRVLTKAGKWLVGSGFTALLLSMVAPIALGHHMWHAYRHSIDTGMNSAILIGLLGSAIVSTMGRIHHKARHAYEELEKGV
jgi:hypothetical protein